MATPHLSTQKPVPLIPILKYSKVVNGMLCVELENIDSLYAHYEQTGKYNKDYELSLSYLFKFAPTLKSDLSDIAWKSIKLGTHNTFTHKNEFTLKLPLYLLSYSMSFNVTLSIFYTLREVMNVINTTSDNQLIHIPSILIQSQYSNGEHVEYCVENAGFVRSGTILDISENNIVKIRTDSGYSSLNGNADIVNVAISKLYRDPTEGRFIVDITNRRQAETDLIIKTNNADNISVFSVICDGLFDFYYYAADDFETEWYHFQFMSVLIATHIYAFLYGVNAENCSNYGIQCVFGDSYLFCEEQWKYHILRTYEGLKKGNLWNDIQESHDGGGYTCDICRAQLSWYDFMYHCQCTHHRHDFCLTCVHSLIQQYEELELFLTQILHKIINDDCIEEILTFCVGKVRKFDNESLGIDAMAMQQHRERWGKRAKVISDKGAKKRLLVEWRFVTSDNQPHTVVLQHTQDAKPRTRRMLWVDGSEKYNNKSSASSFRIAIDKDVVVVYIIDAGDMHQYRLTINNASYADAFKLWENRQR